MILFPAHQPVCSHPLSGLKVGIYHPWLSVGGSECTAVWGAFALSERGASVTLHGPEAGGLANLDAAFGTSTEGWIGKELLQFRGLPTGKVSGYFGTSGYLHHFEKRVRETAKSFDLLISAYNPMDFGKPGIHLIGDLTFDHALNEAVDPVGTTPKNTFHGAARTGARALSSRLFPKTDIRRLCREGHLIVANSQWTQQQLRNRYQLSDIPILYPPVPPFPRNLGLVSRRVNRFVYIGRISPEKRVERMIRILAAVREDFPIEFRVIGEIPESAYGRKIQSLVDQHADWITATGRLVGTEKFRELAAADFGIQGRDNEPFGIGVAEMAQAGSILFHPRNGGQNEILQHEALSFEGDDDAITKIKAVLSLPSEDREELRKTVVRRSMRFDIDYFKETLVDLVSEWAGASKVQPAISSSNAA